MTAQFAGGHNFDRLTKMLYPKRIQAPTIRRELDMVYGANLASRDSILGRVTRIDDNRLGEASRYEYAGVSRRVSQQYGYDGGAGTQTAPVSQSYADNSQNPVVGYPGLDVHGRVKDLHFKNAAGTNSTLQKFEYGHDPLDQRIYARVTQRSSSGTAVENERSYLYGYDRLGRLTSSKMGALDGAYTSVNVPASGAAVRDSLWTLDLLGNWVGDSQTSTPGRRTLGVPQATGPPHREVSSTDTVTRTNAIAQRQTVDGSNTTNLNPVHDPAGNLVLDQDYFYQYDAWNRLVQVSERGTLSGVWASGELAFTGTAGPWIVHYTYDGLGRLIRKQSLWPDLDPYGRPQVRTKHFYYDGVRRIQETVTDPLVNDSDTPIEIDDEADLPPLATQTLTSREYVHSPGYVDELVAQVDVPLGASGADRPAWVIQDANYNLVALVDDSGTMLHQYTWDPYGQPVAIDRYDTGINGAPQPFENRIGHQGLFFDRFDGQAQNVLLPQLAVDAATGLGVKGLYQNGNRSYSPYFGRFMQRDPHGAGHPLRIVGGRTTSSHGTVIGTPALTSMYGDGLSTYGYLGSQPVSHTDPNGLFFGGLAGLMMSGLDSMQAAEDSLDEARQGLGMLFSLHALLGGTIVEQEYDADWASDWSQGDYEYSKAINQHEYAGWGEEESGISWAGIGGKPKRASLTGRKHGGPGHMKQMRQASSEIAKKGVPYHGIRKNQELVNEKGVVISKNRPDVQGINSKTKTMYVREACWSQTYDQARLKRPEYQRAADAEGLLISAL